MAKEDKVYKCEMCGNIVSVIHAGPGALVCCGEEMNELEVKTGAEGKEKHIPVVTVEGNEVTVTVGSINHPMEDSHYISLIQILRDGKVLEGKRLFPGQEPKVKFILEDASDIKARALCNVHGLWGN